MGRGFVEVYDRAPVTQSAPDPHEGRGRNAKAVNPITTKGETAVPETNAGPNSEAPRDPWAFQRWALEQRAGNSSRKLLLVQLAIMAESNTGTCWPSQRRLAEWCECSERSARLHLRSLEAAGLIDSRPRRRPNGSQTSNEYLLLAPWVTSWPDGEIPRRNAPADPADGSPLPGHERPATPRDTASTSRSTATAKSQSAPSRATADEVPDDFPDELRPHAREVMRVLRDVAERTPHARAVKVAALASVIMARQRKPLVKAAHDYRAWAIGRNYPHRDVVSAYRNWLEREPDLAAVELVSTSGTRQATPTRQQQRDAALVQLADRRRPA